MRRWNWLILGAVVLLGLVAGVAIGGRQDVPPAVQAWPGALASLTTSTDVTVANPEASSTTVASTSAPTVLPEDVRETVAIVVANAMGRGRIAGRGAQLLGAAGWMDVTPSNALRSDGMTRLFAKSGFEAAARQVAIDLGLGAVEPDPMPNNPLTDSKGDSDIVVLLGRDFAG
jgi:hypothetical protein